MKPEPRYPPEGRCLYCFKQIPAGYGWRVLDEKQRHTREWAHIACAIDRAKRVEKQSID